MAQKPAAFMTQVEVKLPGTNYFDLSHDHITSMKMGELVPYLALDCIPGDRIKVRTEAIMRMAPMIAPAYSRVHIKTRNFFVPWRLLWDNFEKYYRNDDVIKPAAPYIDLVAGAMTINDESSRLPRYMGIPPAPDNTKPDLRVCPAVFSAYQFIYNEYFRDQNLQAEVLYKLVDGNNTVNTEALTTLRRVAWGRDYFTSGLPFAQKGPAVSIPVGNFQDVPVLVNDAADGRTITATPSNIPVDNDPVTEPLIPEDTLYAKTSLLDAEATTINTWRKLLRLQEYYERLARVGSRFTEVLRGFFGVSPRDERLQRPEYISGTSTRVKISEVLNTTGTETAPQGNMAGHGIAVIDGDTEYYEAVEPGFIVGIAYVMPETVYFQGLPRMLHPKGDVMDSFVFPQFANIGEQPVLNKEVYAWTDDPVDRDETFNYQPVYASYRFLNSRISGDFQGNLKFWTLVREFEALPGFNAEFIEAQPSDRIFAVQDGTDQFWCWFGINLDTQRPLPVFGTPSI